MNRLQIPGTLRTVEIGSLRVSYVPDGAVKMVPRALFPSTTDDDWAENADYLDPDGRLTISSGGLLVERGDRAVLLDAGYGPFPEPTANLEYGIAAMYGGGFLDNLRELGRDPGSVEAVAISHLHPEHVGWSARPEFAHAPCLLSAAEWDSAGWVDPEVRAALSPRVRPIAAGEEIFPGVVAVSLPGHTPGQLGFEVSDGDATLVAFADAMHSAVQVAHPDWPLVGEPDPAVSARTRREVLTRLADEDTLGFGIHFADVGFGHVRRAGDGFRWEEL